MSELKFVAAQQNPIHGFMYLLAAALDSVASSLVITEISLDERTMNLMAPDGSVYTLDIKYNHSATQKGHLP